MFLLKWKLLKHLLKQKSRVANGAGKTGKTGKTEKKTFFEKRAGKPGKR